jgi:hypothetical protein
MPFEATHNEKIKPKDSRPPLRFVKTDPIQDSTTLMASDGITVANQPRMTSSAPGMKLIRLSKKISSGKSASVK